MARKVRHPYQILEVEEMVIGDQYVFIIQDDEYPIYADSRIFGGIIKDNLSAVNNPPATNPRTITVHPDGLRSDGEKGLISAPRPTLVYWPSTRGKLIGWDYVDTYLGEEGYPDRHLIIVLEKYWIDDPKLHVMDWKNPDDVVERKLGKTHKVVSGDWEKCVNAKRDEAMADFFGF